jgi:hypothetical protein
VLIDEKLKPWLIEINHAPSFATDTPLDFKMKKDVIADTIQLLGFSFKRKKRFIKHLKLNIKKRMLQTKKTVKVNVPTSKRELIAPVKKFYSSLDKQGSGKTDKLSSSSQLEE